MGYIDMTGKRFGRLTVIGRSEHRDSTTAVYWDCKCDCGTIKPIRGTTLRAGRAKSCGCLFEEKRKAGITKKDIVGQRFGRLVVLKETDERTKCGEVKYLCQCDCGNKTVVAGTSLRYGNTKSCGCLARESTRKRSYKHGLSNHPLYKIWHGLLERCYHEEDTAYKYYGARGITVCDEWRQDAAAFIKWALDNGWEKGLEVDRIDNYAGYSPENCRIVTHKENMANQRRSQDKKEK